MLTVEALKYPNCCSAHSLRHSSIVGGNRTVAATKSFPDIFVLGNTCHETGLIEPIHSANRRSKLKKMKLILSSQYCNLSDAFIPSGQTPSKNNTMGSEKYCKGA